MTAHMDKARQHTGTLRILVAEDHEINSKVIQLVLDRLGYGADFVENGVDVLSALKKQAYDLIFMDMEMPLMGGIETTQEIIKMMDGQTRPIIVAMTAHALPEAHQECIDAGMDDYISKPFRIETVQQMINKYFQ